MTQKIVAPYPNKISRPISVHRSSYRIAHTLFSSFGYAWSGVQYAFQTQRNFRIHTLMATVALSLAGFLRLSGIEIALIGVTIAAVMGLELLNTAVEAVVDLTVGNRYHDLARVAKDCAAGAVLLAAFASVFVAAILILPPLVQMIFWPYVGY
ncbi:diacylglycerol kinase family protein [Candidatus Synechococcus calcipolaris G9]|uniref:Diacylglycerol kinase family protein n=1 Tax=Candidatus Synechococcus calcipolaris G9 TaxID=1497997 RepID=A0ABT6F369_9SYNE|nr:diacylglycerol kinase family protein [Candidatus Synechococcus calcipolaris]MDG2992264.1 diacylglycerol kinase family protein [Candidatus Synechococcus calcipolaris G9]